MDDVFMAKSTNIQQVSDCALVLLPQEKYSKGYNKITNNLEKDK